VSVFLESRCLSIHKFGSAFGTNWYTPPLHPHPQITHTPLSKKKLLWCYHPFLDEFEKSQITVLFLKGELAF
jgi:hypothetical protein